MTSAPPPSAAVDLEQFDELLRRTVMGDWDAMRSVRRQVHELAARFEPAVGADPSVPARVPADEPA